MSAYHFALPDWPVCITVVYPLPIGGATGPAAEEALGAHHRLNLLQHQTVLRLFIRANKQYHRHGDSGLQLALPVTMCAYA